MDATSRQLVILVSLLGLLAAVMLFLFVYAPDPLQGFGFSFNIPDPVGVFIDAVVDFIGLIIDGFDLIF